MAAGNRIWLWLSKGPQVGEYLWDWYNFFRKFLKVWCQIYQTRPVPTYLSGFPCSLTPVDLQKQNGGQYSGNTLDLRNGIRYSNGYSHIFDHVRLNGDTCNIVRGSPTIEFQNGGQWTGSTHFWRPSWISRRSWPRTRLACVPVPVKSTCLIM